MDLWFWGTSLLGETVLSTGRSWGPEREEDLGLLLFRRKEERGCCLGSKLIWDGILEEETLKLEVQVLRISVLYLVVIGGRDEENW
jgi:hypothetical protein